MDALTNPASLTLFNSLYDAAHWISTHQQTIAPFIKRIDQLRQSKSPVIIAIAGQSQSGKTILANTFKHALKQKQINVQHIHCDAWIIPPSERTENQTVSDRFQLNKLNQDLTNYLINKMPISMPTYDNLRETILTTQDFHYDDADVILIDGGFTHDSRDFRPFRYPIIY